MKIIGEKHMSARKNSVQIGPALGYDERFGQLDLSGCPSVQRMPADTSFIDDRFGQLDTSGCGTGSRALKEFLQQQLEPAVPESTVHVCGHPFRVFMRNGKWMAHATIEGERHRYSGPTRDDVLATAMHAVNEAHPQFRELSDDEALHVARLAQSGDEPSAFGQYFLSRVGPRVATMDDPMRELLSNAKYRALCDEAAFFIWAARNDNYTPDAEFEQMVSRVAESKPLNGRLLGSLWIRYLDERQNQNTSTNPGVKEPDTPSPAEIQNAIDGASDSEIEKMLFETKKEYAREVRAGRM
jgi:hypothetical protein